MAEIWTYFHKTGDVVRCNGCAYETPNTRDKSAHVDTVWTHLSSAHRDVYERSNHYTTLGSPTTVNGVYKSSPNLSSEAWSYFGKVGDDRVRCIICSREIVHKKCVSTTGLWWHLKSHHIEAYQTTDYFKARTENSSESTRAVTSRQRPELWTHFMRISSSRVKCNGCSRELQYRPDRSSTGDLWKHLRALHSDVFKAKRHSRPRPLNATNEHPSEPVDPSHDNQPVKRHRIQSDVSFDVFYESLKESFARMDPDKVEEMKATILEVVKAASVDE